MTIEEFEEAAETFSYEDFINHLYSKVKNKEVVRHIAVRRFDERCCSK